MAKMNSLDKRIAKSAPIPEPVYNPAVANGPSGGAVANIQPEPLVDVRTPPAMPEAQGGVRDAISRALIGFNRGAGQFKLDPTYNPVGAGIIGGVSAAGAGESDALARRLAAEQPYRDAKAEALKESAKRQAADPFEAAGQARTLDRELKLAREKNKLNKDLIATSTKGLKPADALALNKQAEQDVLLRGIDPSSDEYGTALSARVAELANQAHRLGSGVVKPQPAPLPKAAGSARPGLDEIFK